MSIAADGAQQMTWCYIQKPCIIIFIIIIIIAVRAAP
jgi:hypothetical protein